MAIGGKFIAESGFKPNGRFLLCRPHGGLNDTLCQIEECARYASRFDRLLIVDTRNSELRARFSDYFEPKYARSKILFDADDDLLRHLNTLSCFPSEARGRLHELDLCTYVKPRFVFKDNLSVSPTFDFSRDYEEDVVYHQMSGGGWRSFQLIKKLRLSQDIRPIVLARLSGLDGKYDAVHVRNTDLKTDYQAFFSHISPKLKGKRLLVCSDDSSVIAYARSNFRSLEILTASEIPDTDGRPLHQHGDRRQRTIETLVDLIALGRAEKLFVSLLQNGKTSGFTGLARHLHKNKYLLNDLLGLPNSDAFVFLRSVPARLHLRRRQMKERLQRASHKIFKQGLGGIRLRREIC